MKGEDDTLKVTIPHLGNVYIGAKALFDGLGIEYVLPPPSNKRALETGSLYSPEEICLPFKISLGNYIQSIEQGADTVIITGSCGPCRFGEYCEMQMKLLKKLGYDVDFIVLDVPKDIGVDEFLKRIGKIAQKSSRSGIDKLMALKNALKVTKLMDEIEAKAHEASGYEKNKGECAGLLKKCKKEMMECKSPKEMTERLVYYRDKLKNIERDEMKNPIRVAIIGEIYTIIEPFSNLYIEDKLMEYGVSSKRRLTPSWWVKNTMLSPTKLNSLDIKTASRNYLDLCIGGHARECVGEAVLAQKEGFDGAIQIFPMGCMPEIVAKSILPSISKDLNFPIMTLVVDEMTGEAGYLTRIEAFLDLLERRRTNVLSRS